MVGTSNKVADVSEDASVSDSMSGGSDDRTIPFLRRLRDMLKENEGVVTFIPGSRTNGNVVLGRLIVHDRIQVEATVLPRYFNHSSFASLRRQLNYFSFVRLGKGRQRESTYINEGVIGLDDILALRRRPSGAGGGQPTVATNNANTPEPREKPKTKDSAKPIISRKATKHYVDSIVPVVHLPAQTRPPKLTAVKRNRRAKHAKKTKPMHLPPVSAPFVSEDEESQGKASKSLIWDLTQPTNDPELLEGCTALLCLSGKSW